MAQPEQRLHDYYVQLMLIGDCNVGKSSIMMRFSDDNYVSNYVATIGIDFKVKTVEMGGKRVKVRIWDTAGQERFRTITDAYYRSADGIVLVYDITSRASFDNVKGWIRSIENKAQPGTNIILVGNKYDAEDLRQVKAEEGACLGKAYDIEFLETSAKTGYRIKEVFAHITRDIIRRMSNDPTFDKAYPQKTRSTVSLKSKKEPKEDNECCSL